MACVSKTSTFERLPAEIRLQIYSYLLSPATGPRYVWQPEPEINPNAPSRLRLRYHTAILRVNRRIFVEATDYFTTKNAFCLVYLPHTINGEARTHFDCHLAFSWHTTGFFTQYATRAVLMQMNEPPFRKHVKYSAKTLKRKWASKGRPAVIIRGEDLQKLVRLVHIGCHLIEYSAGLALRLELNNVAVFEQSHRMRGNLLASCRDLAELRDASGGLLIRANSNFVFNHMTYLLYRSPEIVRDLHSVERALQKGDEYLRLGEVNLAHVEYGWAFGYAKGIEMEVPESFKQLEYLTTHAEVGWSETTLEMGDLLSAMDYARMALSHFGPDKQKSVQHLKDRCYLNAAKLFAKIGFGLNALEMLAEVKLGASNRATAKLILKALFCDQRSKCYLTTYGVRAHAGCVRCLVAPGGTFNPNHINRGMGLVARSNNAPLSYSTFA